VVDIVDDFADPALHDRADDAVPSPEAGERGHLVAETSNDIQIVCRIVEQHDHAVGGHDHVTRFLQREAGDAIQIEQRRELFRKAVDQVDLAIQIQDLCCERLLLRGARDEMLEQDRDGARRFRPCDRAETDVFELDRKMMDAVDGRQFAVQEPAFSILDRDGHAEHVSDR
jgi:hypothetical protein